jgi:NTE family protein
LQGGGVHGAFTWGVLDRLLEQPLPAIEAISGSSAGALNAAVLASALARGQGRGGREQARAALASLWHKIAGALATDLLHPALLPLLGVGSQIGWSAPQVADLLSGWLSPYQFNPFDLNPLRRILADLVDVEALSAPGAIKLFVAATNVQSGQARLFGNADLSLDALIASTSLPWLHQAVKLDDGHYWDGGFVANPPLLPLIEECRAEDLLLVRLNPSEHAALPVTVREIRARVGAIVFDSPLQRELDSIAWLRRIARRAGGAGGPAMERLAELRLHVLRDDDLLRSLDPATKLSADWPVIERLRDAGRAAAAQWLARMRAASRRVA